MSHLTVLYARPSKPHQSPRDVNYSLIDSARTVLASRAPEEFTTFFGDLYRVACRTAEHVQKSREILDHYQWEVVREQVESPGGEVLCAYVPLTGPVPDGLAPGESFVHHGVAMTPELAQVFLNNYTDRARTSAMTAFDGIVERIRESRRSQREPELQGLVCVSLQGKTFSGYDLLHAVIEVGGSVLVDVVHNSSPGEWDRIDQGPRRSL